MSPTAPIADDEVIFRHIPGGTTFQAPGPRITSKNLELRKQLQETGVSVSRSGLDTVAAVMARRGNPETGSRIAAATASDIRQLGLEVVPVPLDDDRGHSEIRSAAASLDDQVIRRQLAKLFAFLDPA